MISKIDKMQLQLIKKHFTTLSLILWTTLQFTPVIAQDSEEIKIDQIKGNVKSVVETRTMTLGEEKELWRRETRELGLDSKGNIIKNDLVRSFPDDYQYGFTRVYDSLTNLLKIEYVHLNHDTLETNIYQRDSLNRIKDILTYDGERLSKLTRYLYLKNNTENHQEISQRKKDTSNNFFQYDEEGNLLKEFIQTNHFEHMIIHKYDEKNRLIETKSLILKSPSGLILTINEDEENELSEANVVGDVEDFRNYILQFEYNSKGECIREIRRLIDHRIYYDLTYSYNENGLITKINRANSVCCDAYKNEIKYEFDSKGNWIRKELVGTGSILYVTTRIIEYHQ